MDEIDKEITLEEFLRSSPPPPLTSSTNDAPQKRISIDLELFNQEGETNTYSWEFKQDVVQRVVKHQYSPKDVGKMFGVSPHTVREWVKRSGNQLPKVYKKLTDDCTIISSSSQQTVVQKEGEGDVAKVQEEATVIVVAQEDATVLVLCSHCGGVTHSDHLFACLRCKKSLSRGESSKRGRS